MIVTCGEALIDLFVRHQPPLGLRTEAVAGGSLFNLACGLARLGSRAAFLSTLSEDALGEYLAACLRAAGVDDRYLRRCPQRTALSLVATTADGRPHYTIYGEEGADRALRIDDLPSEFPEEVRCIAAGSYALAVEPIAGAIEALIRREAGRRVISVDPNIRPALIGDISAFRPRLERILSAATIIKASLEDLELLYGFDVRVEEVARDWLSRGPALVVVTRGPDGASAFSDRGIVSQRGLPVAVADTVGAGDMFHAALLAHFDAAGLLEPGRLSRISRIDLATALTFAVAASALACTRRGADPPSRSDLDRFLQQFP